MLKNQFPVHSLALAVSTVVYVAVSIVAVSLVPYAELATADAPLTEAAAWPAEKALRC